MTATTAVTAATSHVPMSAAGRRIWRAVRRNRKATAGALLLLFFCFLGLFPGLIAHHSPTAEIYPRSLGPSSAHPFGTTAYGQDIFAQVVFGTRQVLIIAIGAGFLATAIAAIVGVSAAYLGGVSDGVLGLITDVLLVIPLFPLLIVIAAYVHSSSTLVLITVLTLTGWSYTARQLRSQALSLRTKDFLAAARVRGERAFYIIGVAAAYLGGFTDGVLNLFTDVVLVIPLFPLLIVIAAYVHNSGTGVLIAVLFAILAADILTALLDPRTRTAH